MDDPHAAVQSSAPSTQAHGNGYSGDGESNIGGVVFDPTTNRLYVLAEEATGDNGSEAWPEMFVYQVGPPPAATTPGNPIVVGNTSSGFSTTGSGWTTLANGYAGEPMQVNTGAAGTATATWQASGLAAGSYTLSVDWNAQPNSNTDAAVYQIYDGSTLVQTVYRQPAENADGPGRWWTPVPEPGDRHGQQPGHLKVVVTSQDGGDLVADALEITPRIGSAKGFSPLHQGRELDKPDYAAVCYSRTSVLGPL